MELTYEVDLTKRLEGTKQVCLKPGIALTPRFGLILEQCAKIGVPFMSGLPTAESLYQKFYFFETPAFQNEPLGKANAQAKLRAEGKPLAPAGGTLQAA